MLPPLSIVIPSHKRADLLQLCLRSVCRYAPVNSEILVVDDASPQAIVSATAQQFDGVRVLRLERSGGFCVAANAGLRAARAAVVELLNDDTEVSPGWAEAAVAHFDDDSVGAVAPLVLHNSSPLPCTQGRGGGGEGWEIAPHKNAPLTPGPSPLSTGERGESGDAVPYIDSAGDRYFVGGVAGKRGHGQPLGPAYLQGGAVFGASASSAFYRRELVLAVGGFPEEFGAYFEDVDLAFRLHRAGATIHYEPRSCVWHRVSASYGAPDATLLERQSRNEELVFWRNLPTAQLLRALPLHAAVVAGKAWRRWREGQFLPFLRGRLRVLGEAANIVRHRQSLRRLNYSCDDQEWGVEARYWGTGQ